MEEEKSVQWCLPAWVKYWDKIGGLHMGKIITEAELFTLLQELMKRIDRLVELVEKIESTIIREKVGNSAN